MSYSFAVEKLTHQQRVHRVLVVTPETQMRATGSFSYDPFATRRAAGQAAILEEVATHEKVGAIVMRASDDVGRPLWRLDANNENDLPNVAERTLLELLPTWRACLELGIYAVVFTGLGEQAPMLRDASSLLADRYSRCRDTQESTDNWIFAHFVHFLGTSHGRAMGAQVPSTLGVMRHHGARAMERIHGAADSRDLRIDPPQTLEAAPESRPSA